MPRAPPRPPLAGGEFDNAGGMMLVNEKLICSFRILRPAAHKQYYKNEGTNGGPL